MRPVQAVSPSALSELLGKSLKPFPDALTSGAVGNARNILILSGGGQWGAYGATYLRGWSQHGGTGDAARPKAFDVVTGVSTGALQATFAFLGSDFDENLVEAYTIKDEKELVDRYGSLFFLSHGSMADIAPLETYIRAKLRPLLDKVAAEPENRQLFVGTVDGLDGKMYAIDLTRIARELKGPEREQCYVGALLASAAVPVVFRQLTISGHPYLDGGVRHSVFVTQFEHAAGQRLEAGGIKGNLYIVVNGDPTPAAVEALPAKLLPTINRLRNIVFNQVEMSSIYGAASQYPGLRTRITNAAGNRCNAKPDEEAEIFSSTVMRCLRDYGDERWKIGSPWVEYHMPQK